MENQGLSLFEKWFKEYHDFDVIKTKNGFMTYKIDGKVCFIIDMFALERGKGESAILADMVTAIARSKGCTSLVGFINLPSPYPEISLVAQIKYGFKIDKVYENKIVLKKEI